METIVLTILKDEAIPLLRELERLQFVRSRSDLPTATLDLKQRFEGSMTKQTPEEIENQCNQLRNEWN